MKAFQWYQYLEAGVLAILEIEGEIEIENCDEEPTRLSIWYHRDACGRRYYFYVCISLSSQS